MHESQVQIKEAQRPQVLRVGEKKNEEKWTVNFSRMRRLHRRCGLVGVQNDQGFEIGG